MRRDAVERLLEIGRVLKPEVDGMAAGLGLTPTGTRILALLDRLAKSRVSTKSVGTSEVAVHLNLVSESVSRELASLLRHGYVTRRQVGKRNELTISATGRDRLQQFRDQLEPLNRKVLRGVHRDSFHIALERIESRLEMTVRHAEGTPVIRKRKLKAGATCV